MIFESVLKVIRGIVKLRGATDNTLIGNASDGIKTNLRNSSGVELLGQTTMSGSVPVVVASDQVLSATTDTEVFSSFSPDPGSYNTGTTDSIQVDASGNLMSRGQVLSDEGSIRDDFSGSSLTTTLTGTLTFTSGSSIVTGSGTSFTTQIDTGQYLKKSSDSETFYVQVASVDSDTSLTLEGNYGGTTSSTTGVVSNWGTTTGTGGSISVANSLVTVTSGTTNGSMTCLHHDSDYLPFNTIVLANISQRIANQTGIVGMMDSFTSPVQQAVVVFDGTVSTTVKFKTSSSSAASDTQTTTVTLPNNGITSTSHLYEIDLTGNQATLTIDGVVVAIHTTHIPGPYTVLQMVAQITNSGTVTTTNLNVDYFFFSNLDQVQVTNDFKGEPMKVQLMGKSSTTGLPLDLNLDPTGNLIVTPLNNTNSTFSFGYVTTAATTTTVVRDNTYTEQSSNAQRSVVSSSASDTSAGTGARSVTITYLDSTGAGPYTETITLSGVTPVNTVATNICFIEKIQVTTVGSTGSNVGTISLKAATAGGGATIWVIDPTDNQTFSAHHYVPSGKTCNITGVSTGHNGTTVGSGGLFVIKALPIGISNAVEVQVTDFIRLYGQSSTFSRNYTSPVKVTGPARLTCYVTPETSSSIIYRAAFDFFEP